MNSRTLVFALFAAWSFLCWRWYVCGIKDACEPKNVGGMVATPAIEPDTTPTVRQEAVQPVGGGSVDESAIDRVQLVEIEDRMVIHFPYSSTRREDNDAIDEYLSQLAQHLIASGGSVTISGHSDFVGDTKTNYGYGIRRANAIRAILVKKGVNKSQIKCKTYGESRPKATNDTALGRYKNRRAEIQVNN